MNHLLCTAVTTLVVAWTFPQSAFAYGATARTASGTSVTTRFFSPNAETPAPVNTRIWFVADSQKNGVPTSPAPGAILGADDVLIFEDVVDGTIVGAQAGKYQRIGINVPDTLKDADIYCYLWNFESPLAAVPAYQPKDGSTFGLYKLGVIPPPAIGNAAWDITNNVVSTQYRVGAGVANRPPVIDQPASQTVVAGTPWTLQILATDPDAPAQVLRYSVTNGPAGLSVDALTGRVSWTPAAPGQFSFDFIATDNGAPPLSTTARILVVVDPKDLSPFQFASVSGKSGRLELAWPSTAGRKYRLEFTSSLSAINWESAGEIAGTDGQTRYTGDFAGGSRFYRIVQLP